MTTNSVLVLVSNDIFGGVTARSWTDRERGRLQAWSISVWRHIVCAAVVLVCGQKRLPVIARVIRDPHLRSQGTQTLKLTVGRGRGTQQGAKILSA